MEHLSLSVTKNMTPSPVDINQAIFKLDIYAESDNPEYILICNTHSGTWVSIREVNAFDCNSQRLKTKERLKRTYRDKSRRKETRKPHKEKGREGQRGVSESGSTLCSKKTSHVFPSEDNGNKLWWFLLNRNRPSGINI